MFSGRMLKQRIRQEIWLDLLCWESIIRILIFFRGCKVTVYYCQVSILFIPLFQGILQRLAGVSLVQINNVVLGNERINGISAFEAVHTKLRIMLQDVEKKWDENREINDFAIRNRFNISKIKNHIKERGYYLLYRPVEIGIIADIKTKEKHCFMFKKTPFTPMLKNAFGDNTVLFYRVSFSQYFHVIHRNDYTIDTHIRIYYSSNLKPFLCISAKWIRALVNLVLLKICVDGKVKEDLSQANICVEQLQSRYRQDDINDLFWFEGSQINPDNVVVLETENIDLESRQMFAGIGVKRVRVKPNPLLLVRRIILRRKEELSSAYVEAEAAFLAKAIFTMLKCMKYIFVCSEASWIASQFADYKFSTLYWLSVFKQLNSKLLWTMNDGDNDKLSKAQAVEMLNGIYAGSHWSNFPLVDLPCDKHYDVLFTWGEHFKRNIFCDNDYLEVFTAGYPSDHYFVKLAKKSEGLRKKYDDKFVLSYQDNAMANDMLCSISMQINMHEMLLSLLEENSHVVIFLKPKRRYVFEKMIEMVPRISDFIKAGRIVTFFGDTLRTKEAPAMVGMASDLVVGLGISTAAAECYFSGTLAFHADLTGFTNNEFGNKGLGNVVFRDIKNLKNTIQDCINNGVSERYQEAKGIYHMLDPFQDGQAYKRVGFVLRNLQELLSQGHSREEATEIVKDRYNDYVQAAAMLN